MTLVLIFLPIPGLLHTISIGKFRTMLCEAAKERVRKFTSGEGKVHILSLPMVVASNLLSRW